MSADLYHGLTEREGRIKGYINIKTKKPTPNKDGNVNLQEVQDFIKQEELKYRQEQEHNYDKIVEELAKEMEWQKATLDSPQRMSAT